MSTKRKHCQLDSTHLVRTPTIRVSRFVHNLYLYTQPEENQLLQSCAMIYNTVANHGRPSVQSGDTNNPTGLPTNSFDGLFDEPTGEPASKRPVLEWHNPAIDPNTLCTVNNPTHGIGAYFDSVRAGVQHNQGAKANSNNWDQQASTNPSTEQTQLLPSPHVVMPGVSHPPLTDHPSASYLSTNYAAVHPDQTQRSAVPEPEIEMVTVEPPEPGIVATRTGKNWLDQEKHCLIGSYVGPNVQVDPLVLARYTPRRSSSVKVVPKVWYTLWNENYKATRELSAVMRESWTLVDTFQDIFSLVEYTSVRNQISFDQCKARFLLEPNLINPAIEEAKTAMVIPTQLKAPEVVLWLQNEWFDWFQARGFRTCPDTQRSSIAQPKGPPSNTSGSLRRKRSSHTVTSTASLPASLPSHTPASQPALSVQHTNRLRAPSGILVPSAALVGTQSPLAVAPRVSTATPDKAAVTSATPRIFSRHPQLPTDSGQGSIEGSSELYVHGQSKVGGNALQIPENTASLSELVRQNQRIIELFEESLENKWSTMKSAQIAESEANAARFHKELLDSATSTIERFVALAQANQFNHRTLMYDMMRDEKSTDRARLHAENYLINLSNNKSDFITLDGLVTELIKVIETRDKSAPS